MIWFKNQNIEVTDNYFEAGLKLKRINAIQYLNITSIDYINNDITNVEEAIKTKLWKLPDRITMLITLEYALEIDGTPEIDANDYQYYQ